MTAATEICPICNIAACEHIREPERQLSLPRETWTCLKFDAPDYLYSGPIGNVSGTHAIGTTDAPVSTYIRADLVEAQTKAAVEAEREACAEICDVEADKCDDAVKWGGSKRYVQDCKAASYAIRDRAAAIRARSKP